MDKTYTFKYEVKDEDGNVIVFGSVPFLYENVKFSGDCESVDGEVGTTMRRFILEVDRSEELERAIAEELTTNTF